MEERNHVELRSEDVQEILGTPPGWLVRWGTSVALAVFAALVGIAAFMRYPDVVEEKIVLTTSVPPVDVVARTDGYIARLLVGQKDTVRQNQLLAVLKSTARYMDMLRLDSISSQWQRNPLDSFEALRPPRNLELGEVQAEYAAFLQNLDNFQFGKESKSASVRSNLSAISVQIYQIQQAIAFDQKVLARVSEQRRVAEEMYAKQKELFDQTIISRADFERERTKVAELENQQDRLEEGIIRKRSEIIDLQKNQTQLTSTQDEVTSTTTGNLLNSLNALRSSLDRWKQTYLLTAPISGVVSQNKFFSEQQFVKLGDQVLTVVPQQAGKDKIIGRVEVPVAKAGKVKERQNAVIKLDNYPYTDYGTIEGVVVSKSLVPKDGRYSIIITLPRGLQTSRNERLEFEQQMHGSAEIITENKGLLQRILDQMFVDR